MAGNSSLFETSSANASGDCERSRKMLSQLPSTGVMDQTSRSCASQPVRIRFSLENARLYAYWCA